MKLVRIGSAELEIHDDGLTVTRLHDGATIPARPQRNAEYRARAASLGYGADTLSMSREHEITHSLLAHWLGLVESPTLRGVASGDYWPHWDAEEAAVLAIQRFALITGVDLVAVADRCMAQSGSP